MLKRCKVCLVEKPLDQFRKNTDGQYVWHERRCKQCNTKARLAWNKANPEKAKAGKRRYRERYLGRLRAYDRKRDREPTRYAKIIQRSKALADTPEGKREALTRLRMWRAEYPEKYRAETAVGNALRDGKLKKGPCASCGKTEGRIIGHHHNYTKPLDVTWLCPACHGAEHRVLRWGGGANVGVPA